jgi:scyllo-inositol 2-dehydrogenase (NADP+)
MNPIQVGLIGYGGAGATFHAPLILAEDRLRLARVVTSRREQVALIPGARATATVTELLADHGIQLVVVASPSDSHFEIARQALEAGKHVVVDKPITLASAEADELIELARRRGLALSVFQNRRWDGDFLTVRRLISEGALGRVYHFEARYDRFRPRIRVRWREMPGPGAGTLYDLGPHLIDQALQLFGMPRAITADAFPQRPGSQAIDYFHLILDYGAARAILHASVLSPAPVPHFGVHGDGGSFIKYGMDQQEDALKAGKGPRDPGWGVDSEALHGELTTADGARRKVVTEPGAYQRFYAMMAEALLAGAPLPVDPADARDNIRVIEAALESAAEARTIKLG